MFEYDFKLSWNVGTDLGSQVTPTQDEGMSPSQSDAILEFKKRDKQAFSILIQLVDKPILHQIINCKTSKEMWDKTCPNSPKNWCVILVSAAKKILQHETWRKWWYGRQHSSATLRMLNSQIEELGTSPFSKDMVISKMLSNLPTAYDTFQTTWKTVAPEQHAFSTYKHGY